jgi:hypothetical protein
MGFLHGFRIDCVAYGRADATERTGTPGENERPRPCALLPLIPRMAYLWLVHRQALAANQQLLSHPWLLRLVRE